MCAVVLNPGIRGWARSSEGYFFWRRPGRPEPPPTLMDSFTYGDKRELAGDALALASALYEDLQNDEVGTAEAVLARLHEIASALQVGKDEQRKHGRELRVASNQGVGWDWLSLCANIRNESQDEHLLFSASGVGNTEVVRGILEAGASVDVRDADGYSPLSVAATVGHPEVVRLLLRFGANADVENVECIPLVEEVLDEISYSPLDGVGAGEWVVLCGVVWCGVVWCRVG